MANNISLKKFNSFTKEALFTGMQYMQEKAMALKLADENVNTKANSAEKENSNQNQRG